MVSTGCIAIGAAFRGCHMKHEFANACVQHVDSKHHAIFDCPKYLILLIYLGKLILCDLITRNPPCEGRTFLARVPRVGHFPLS